MKKMFIGSLVVGLMLALGAMTAEAQGKGKGLAKGSAKGGNKYHAYMLTGESIGLSGYDPVAYYPEGGGKPQKGLFNLTYTHDGVTWRFATKENLEAFKKDPAKYLPAYGGWCAFAIGAENLRVESDPENYLMRDGKVLVFYRDPKNDAKALWNEKADEYAKAAEKNWPVLSK